MFCLTFFQTKLTSTYLSAGLNEKQSLPIDYMQYGQNDSFKLLGPTFQNIPNKFCQFDELIQRGVVVVYELVVV